MTERRDAAPLNDRQYLESRGWRLLNTVRTSDGSWYAWDHPDHQPSRRGYFTTANARNHQKQLDNGYTCDCVPKEPS